MRLNISRYLHGVVLQVMGKCVTAQYRMLEEYKADIQNIVHNVVIYHGAHSNMADQARQMFRDCVYDITELTTCRDCYRCHSSFINARNTFPRQAYFRNYRCQY